MFNALYGNSVDVSRVLIDAGSDVNMKNNVSVFDDVSIMLLMLMMTMSTGGIHISDDGCSGGS